MSPVIACASCRCPVLGTAIGEVHAGEEPRMWHPWCWHTGERAAEHLWLDAIAHDLAKREKHTEA